MRGGKPPPKVQILLPPRLGCSVKATQQTLNLSNVGSNPATPTTFTKFEFCVILIIMKCEFSFCDIDHDGSFGSGRFCSLKCARAFSTAEKRKFINEKVSKTLSKGKRTLADLVYSNIITQDGFEEACKRATNINQVLKELAVSKSGGSYEFAQRLIKDWNVDVSHFKTTIVNPLQRLTIRPNEPKGRLWLYLTKIGREYKCEGCGIGPEWNNKKLTLQVDHINGVNYDHRPENLRFLCPNCHSQTDTFCWKNASK